MAVTVLTGLQDDSTILSNRRVIDMNPVVAQLDPDQSQFNTMLTKLSSRPAFSSKVEWLEDQYMPRVTTLAASATSAATTIDVATDTGAYFNANDVVRIVSTGEAVKVSSISTDTLTVVRAIGDTAAASAASGGDVVILANASLQGATLPTRRQTKKTAAYNYTQIVRTPYGFTNTLTESKLYGGPEPMQERKKKAVEHTRMRESLLFFGARDLITSGANPQGFVGGAVEFISTNVKNPAGQVTKATFDGYLDSLLQHGEIGSKVAFAAPLPARIISTYGSNGLGSAWGAPDLASASAKFGVHVDGFISGAYGATLPIVVKREWSDFASTTSGYGSWLFAIDMSRVSLRPLRDMRLLLGRQANDADTQDEEYLSEFSLEFQNEAAHLLVKGMTS